MGKSLRIVAPHAERVRQIDEVWPTLRDPQNAPLHWQWSQIQKKGKETLALVGPDDGVVGLWTSRKPVVDLPEGNFYRLDYMEVHPSHVSQGFGKLMIAVACRQAQCHQSSGLLIGALPNSAQVYRGLGAEERIPAGWQVARGLIPFVLVGEPFDRLVEVCDGYVQEKK